jgi:hypothetical protein
MTLAPAVFSSAATRSPRSPSRSQNATLAPSATKRLTVASPMPDAPPVTAATLPSSLPILVTFHCVGGLKIIATRRSLGSPAVLLAHDLFRPAFARRGVKPNDEPCHGLCAGGKSVPTPDRVPDASGAGFFGIMR